jgi:hypothetical protein
MRLTDEDSLEENRHEAVNWIEAGEIGKREAEQYHGISVRTLRC